MRFFVIGAGPASNGRGTQSDRPDQQASIQFRYVCERRHLPVEHGIVEFEIKSKRWARGHNDVRVQKMAECYLESYLEKCRQREIESVAS